MHSALMHLALTSAFLAEWGSEAGMDSAMVRILCLSCSEVLYFIVHQCYNLMTALYPGSPFHSRITENLRFLKLLYVLRHSIYEEILFYCRSGLALDLDYKLYNYKLQSKIIEIENTEQKGDVLSVKY